MTTSRANILGRLRAAQQPFTDVPRPEARRLMIDMAGADLVTTFIERARALAAYVTQPASDADAVAQIVTLIGSDKTILAWDFDRIPLQSLGSALAERGITVSDPHDGSVRLGITGVDAALAATGSLVVSSREGQPRSVSLLPTVHIAVLRAAQIVAHLDDWLSEQSTNPSGFRQVGNHVIISGASRTADIGMELVMGAHGPRDLHVMVLP